VSTEHRRLVIGHGSAGLRRALGPTGWVVFEQLLACSTGPVDDCRAEVSVRSMAAELGLSKDTVARALCRLRSVGLVAPSQSRATSGVFAGGCYSIAVPAWIDFDDDIHPAPIVADPRPVPKRLSASRQLGSQLALAIDA